MTNGTTAKCTSLFARYRVPTVYPFRIFAEVKRTSAKQCRMSAFDPKRTLGDRPLGHFQRTDLTRYNALS